MEIKKRIDIAKKLFKISPLREKIKNNVVLPITITEAEKYIFDEIIDSLTVLEEKLIKPLNIVLIGEVKAGKSTLLNTLVEDEISPTDILEATAVILEVGYGNEEKAVIYYNDGNKKEGEIKQIFRLLNNHQNDVEFSSKIEKVQVKKNKESYRYYNLVDTPGLLTITSENEKTTEDYIKWADVILWVLDCNYLGQADIKELIEEIEEYGKPIIGILNKIDTAKGEEEKVISYAKDMYELYFEEIIPLSAKKVFEGVIKGDNNLIKESGFNDLINYLNENIIKSEEVSKEVQMDSILRSLNKIIEKEKYYHLSIKDKANEIIQTYNDIKKHVDYHYERINNTIRDIVRSTVMTDFLERELEYVLLKIDSISMLNSKKGTAEIKMLIQNLGSEENVRPFIELLQNKINKVSKEEWKKASDILEGKIKEKLFIFMEREKKIEEILQDDYYLNNNQLMIRQQYETINVSNDNTILGADAKDIKDALIYSGGAGVALAAYAATLGPAAASITIGTALGALVPPVLVGGLMIASAKSLLTKSKQKKELKTAVLSAVQKARERFYYEIADKYILPKVYENNKKFKEKILDSYIKIVLNNYSINDVKKLSNELDDYINSINSIQN